MRLNNSNRHINYIDKSNKSRNDNGYEKCVNEGLSVRGS